MEIGVDCINPMMVKNDIDGIMEQYGDKITVMGGVDSQTMEILATPEDTMNTSRKGENLPV